MQNTSCYKKTSEQGMHQQTIAIKEENHKIRSTGVPNLKVMFDRSYCGMKTFDLHIFKFCQLKDNFVNSRQWLPLQDTINDNLIGLEVKESTGEEEEMKHEKNNEVCLKDQPPMRLRSVRSTANLHRIRSPPFNGIEYVICDYSIPLSKKKILKPHAVDVVDAN